MLSITEKTARDDLKHRDRERPGNAAPPRSDLTHLWRDAKAVLDDRHVIAHSIALEDTEAQGQAALVIWHPGSGRETRITTPQVLSHVRDIRIACRRFRDAIAAESSA